MKTLTLILPLVLALPVIAGQEPVPWANKFFSGKDQIPPPVILHDFGTLPKGTRKTYRFPMANIYAVEMQVKEPKAPCGCISIIEYTGKMGPMETGHILVEINTAAFDGYKSVKLPVTFVGRDAKTNEPFFSTAQLEIRAISRADVAINPGGLAFGQVPAGQKAEASVTVTYSGRQPNWGITEVGYRKEVFETVAVARVTAPRGSSAFEVTAKLKDTAPTGALDEQVVLKTNDPAAPALTLTVTGAIQAPLSVFPSDVVRIGVEVNQKGSRSVTLQADKPFKVTKVDGQGDGVSVTLLPMQAKKAQPLTIDFNTDKVGVVKKVLTVKTDTGESVKLTVEAVAKEPQ
jgi:hypothetical protein